MVRQDGYGNLQGFSGYRLGPHTITMGYANDASLPDAGAVRLHTRGTAESFFLCFIATNVPLAKPSSARAFIIVREDMFGEGEGGGCRRCKNVCHLDGDGKSSLSQYLGINRARTNLHLSTIAYNFPLI